MNNSPWNSPQDSPYDGGDWQRNEAYAGQMPIYLWNFGNNLLMGGQAFTTGFWPTCRKASPASLTPRSADTGHKYDGRDSFTSNPVTAQPDGNLDFKFTYSVPEFRAAAEWQVAVATDPGMANVVTAPSGTDTNIPTGVAKTVTINTRDLAAGTNYYWRACVNTTPGYAPGNSCGAVTRFQVNKGPGSTVVSGNVNTPNTNTNRPGGSGPEHGVYWKCAQLSTRLTDPESNEVRPYYTVQWTDSNGRLNTVETFNRALGNSDSWSSWLAGGLGYAASGTDFTSDQMRPRAWRVVVNGQTQTQTLTAAQQSLTMTQFLQDVVPDGLSVTWTARGEDRFGASDVGTSSIDPFYAVSSTPRATHNAAVAPSGDQQFSLNNRRFGPPVVTTFHKNTRPNFDSASTKTFKDLNGAELTSVQDGQTVTVETTFVNGGETPMKYYELRDYLGNVRDFEPPTNLTVRKNDGTAVTVPGTALTRVVPDADKQRGNDQSTDDGNVRASWRINLGSNQSGLLAGAAFGGTNNVLNPGDRITLTYQVRANRNQQVQPGDDDAGEFGRRLTPDYSHFWARYQEDYCNNANRVTQVVEKLGATVISPWLRVQRGSVGSNAGIFGYDALAGNQNASFVVQANGALSHFTSALGPSGELENYTSQQAVCTDRGERPGGVDWRRSMIANINRLNSEAKNTNIGQLVNAGPNQGLLNPPGQPNVWVVGSPTAPQDLVINNAIPFRGVGTILVFGNLIFGPNASLTYGPESGGVNSLGVIVSPTVTTPPTGGNVVINPNVTNLVGSYFVLDSSPAVDAEGCPRNVDEFKANSGRVSTGSSNQRLNVQGLFVAGAFDLLRYFTDPSDTQADPAENIYYDGRVLANTPPGFGTFRNTSSWQEIAP